MNHSEKKDCGCGHDLRRRRYSVFRIIGITIGGLAMAVVFALVFGILVKWLWNGLMPGIFGVGTITYWQAFGIIILAKLLFGSFGRHCHDRYNRKWHPDMRHGFHYDNHEMHDRFKRRMHRWMMECCDDEHDDDLWKPKGSYKNWKYYDRYWKEEGKASFEAYIDKISTEKENETE